MSLDIVWGGAQAPQVNEALGLFASRRIWGASRPKEFGEHTSMGVVDGTELIAAVIYHNYDPDTEVIEISGAASSPKWLARHVLYLMYAYPFDQLGCQLVVQRGAEGNDANPLLRRYGFDEYRIPRLRGRDTAEIVFTLTEEQWRSNGYHKEHRQ